jgi:hypothetical protein
MKNIVLLLSCVMLFMIGAQPVLGQKADQMDQVKAKKQQISDKIQTKKIEVQQLRDELKKTKSIDVENRAKYDALHDELLKNKQYKDAIDLKEELIEKSYVKGDRKDIEELGKLYALSGKKEISGIVDGIKVGFDTPPFVKEGRTLVPIRAIVASLKAEVSYDATNRTVTIKKGEQVIELVIGQKVAKVNGVEMQLEVPPQIKNSRTFLPLRFISEQFKAEVIWQKEGQIITIDSNE